MTYLKSAVNYFKVKGGKKLWLQQNGSPPNKSYFNYGRGMEKK